MSYILPKHKIAISRAIRHTLHKAQPFYVSRDPEPVVEFRIVNQGRCKLPKGTYWATFRDRTAIIHDENPIEAAKEKAEEEPKSDPEPDDSRQKCTQCGKRFTPKDKRFKRCEDCRA